MRKLLRRIKLSVTAHIDLLWAITFAAWAAVNGILTLQTEGFLQIVHGFVTMVCTLESAVLLDLYLEGDK